MPNGTIDPRQDYVAELAAECGKTWPTIAAAQVADHYEQFQQEIDDKGTRGRLAGLKEEIVYDDEDLLRCRDISHQLQEVLKHVCFEVPSPLRAFTCEYGVF